jgi:hypothetical protein
MLTSFASCFLKAAVVAAIVVGLTYQGMAATFQLQEGVSPTAGYTHLDVLIRSDNGLENTKQGAGAGLLVGAHPGSGTVTPGPGYLHSVIEFDLTPVVAGIGTSTISNVSFTLWLQANPTTLLPRVDGSPKVDIHSYGFPVAAGTGVNPGSTWNDPDGDGSAATGDITPGGTVGTFLGTFGELTSAGPFTHTITGGAGSPLVTALQAALVSNQKLRLILVEDQADTATRDIAFFKSSALAGATNPPQQHPLLAIDTVNTTSADFDNDGDVDGADFIAWQTNFPKESTALHSEGDADNDGDIDGADLSIWRDSFPSTPGPGAAPVPEPSMVILAAIASSGAGLISWRLRSNLHQQRDCATLC